MKPTFLLGVGAQKAGTTWLHTQLDNLDCADFGCLKEYHIWDMVYSLDKSADSRNRNNKKENSATALRRLMATEYGVYESYFKGLISDEVTLTGDFTPSYSMLSADNLFSIRERLEKAGFDVKVVFLMRDPVQRNWSQLRMMQRSKKKMGIEISDEELLKRFMSVCKNRLPSKRGRYNETVVALREVFDEDELYFEFYEQLFEKESTLKLAKFLNIDVGSFNYQEKVNVSKPIELPDGLIREARKHFSSVYDFCKKEFPGSEELWIQLESQAA